jgi:hypothetical protein
MNIDPALISDVSDGEAAEAVQPSQGAFDHPPVPTQRCSPDIGSARPCLPPRLGARHIDRRVPLVHLTQDLAPSRKRPHSGNDRRPATTAGRAMLKPHLQADTDEPDARGAPEASLGGQTRCCRARTTNYRGRFRQRTGPLLLFGDGRQGYSPPESTPASCLCGKGRLP